MFEKMELVGVLAFATVDSDGAPQIRNISAIHYESDAIYFFTARGKNFCRELLEDGRVQILCYTKYKEMIRMSAKAYAVPEEEQAKWRDIIFEEQPYLANVYPGDTRSIGIIFCIDRAEVEYFNLGVNPIFRDTYTLGGGTITKRVITLPKMHWLWKMSYKMSPTVYRGRKTVPDTAKPLPALRQLL